MTKSAKQSDTTLYDHRGQVIDLGKSGPQLDPDFFRSGRSGGTGEFSSRVSREPYKYHAWFRACVDRIMNPIAALPRCMYREGDDSDVVYEHPVLTLLGNPNPMMNGTELIEHTILNLLLPTSRTPGGQCFWHLESGVRGKKVNLLKGEMPVEIWPYSDNVIKPRMAADGKTFNGWKMVLNGVTVLEYELDEIIRIHYPNPYNPTQGLSPYSAAQLPIYQDTKADEFNTNFFENSGAIGGVLTTDSAEIDERELRMYAEWFSEMYSGAGNAGRIAALGYGLKYDTFMRSNADMQFMEQRKDNRLRIQAVLGMSEEELGIYGQGMNRATADQADRSAWQKTRLPLARRITESVNDAWVRYVKPGILRLKFDTSGIAALRPDYTQRIKDAMVLVQQCRVPPAEAFRMLGLPIDVERYPWLEKAFVPAGLIDAEVLALLGYVAPPATQAAPAKAIVAPPHEAQTTESAQLRQIVETVRAAKDKERDEMWWRFVREVLDPGEKSMRSMFTGEFRRMRNEMLDNVDAWAKSQKSKDVTVRQIVVDPAVFLFDSEAAVDSLMEGYRPEAKKQMERQRKKLLQDYGDAIEWAVTPDNIERFVQSRARRLNEVIATSNEQAKRVINALVEQGLEDQWTPQELAKELKKGLNALGEAQIAGRSKTIARTETGSITSMSNQDAYVGSKIEEHEWLSARDEDVRQDPFNHQIDGTRRKVGTEANRGDPEYMFPTGGQGLLHPLDPQGAAGSVINCRCTTIPVIPEGDE